VLLGVGSLVVLSTIFPLPFKLYPFPEKYVYMDSPGQMPENSLVILTEVKQSFVAPFFPSSVTFASTTLDYSVGSPLGIQKIYQHNGPLFILFNYEGYDRLKYLKQNLKLNYRFFIVEPTSCKFLQTNENYQPKVELCRAKLKVS
jgi:hypothetical protein